MSVHTLTPVAPVTQSPAMVAADSVAVSLHEAFTLARRSKEEKAAGITTGAVKAAHFARQGASAALLVALGVNGKANKALVMAQSLHGLVSGDQVRFALAIPQVLAIAEVPYTYGVDVLADGTRTAKRADWLGLCAHLQSVKDATDCPKAKATRIGKALALFDAIQATADTKRAELQKLNAALEGGKQTQE